MGTFYFVFLFFFILRLFECQLKMMNVQGDQKQANWNRRLKKIRELIQEDHRWTIHALADAAGISYEVCQAILIEKLNISCIAAKFILWVLTNYLKKWHRNMCLELQVKANVEQTFISISLCFPNWKWNWKEDILKQCLTSKENYKRHSTELKRNGLHVSEAWENAMG
jgi:hypothetical protein